MKQVPRITIITICTLKGGGEKGAERERDRGKKAFKTVKFMRATEPQIEIISLCTDK